LPLISASPEMIATPFWPSLTNVVNCFVAFTFRFVA
jgi:hypothetical protein